MVGAMMEASMSSFEIGQEISILTLILNGLFCMKCHAFAGALKCKIKHINREGLNIRVFISIHMVHNMYYNTYFAFHNNEHNLQLMAHQPLPCTDTIV